MVCKKKRRFKMTFEINPSGQRNVLIEIQEKNAV